LELAPQATKSTCIQLVAGRREQSSGHPLKFWISTNFTLDGCPNFFYSVSQSQRLFNMNPGHGLGAGIDKFNLIEFTIALSKPAGIHLAFVGTARLDSRFSSNHNKPLEPVSI
jgi:hypothetical protein